MDVAINLAVNGQADFRQTVAAARKKGLKITQAFDTLGVASGTIDRKSLPALQRLPGVTIEEDRAVTV